MKPATSGKYISGGMAFLRLLRKEGVKYIFGILGREAEFLTLKSSDPLRWILTRHEFSAGIAAEVYGRLTGRPQACFSTFGPGATNLVTAVASAYMDRAPLVAISAQVESHRRRYGQTHQCLDQVRVMDPIAVFSREVESLAEMPKVIHDAFQAATAEPRGPAYLSLPLDLFGGRISKLAAIDHGIGPKGRSPVSASRVSASSIKKIATSIAKSRNPIIITGNALIRDNAWTALRAFAEKWSIPVVETLASRGILPCSHPLNFGAINRYLDGILGRRAVESVFCDVDLILLAGFDLAEDLGPELWNPNGNKRVIRFGLTPNPTPDKIVTEIDAVGSLGDLFFKLASESPTTNAGIDRHRRILELREARAQARVRDRTPRGLIDPCEAVRLIRRLLGPRGLLISDVGMHKQYAGLLTETSVPNTFLCSNGLGTFGFGLPAAIGARLAMPNIPIATVVGDGGFHSGSQELETAARYRLPLILVVFSDASFGLIKHYQARGHGQVDPRFMDFSRVDFPKLARANGCHGVRVGSLTGLKEAISRALNDRLPTLIEAPVDYDYSLSVP